MAPIKLHIFLLATALGLGACDSAKQKDTGKKGGASADDEEQNAREQANSAPVKLSGDADFDGWCVKAAETEPAKGDLSTLFGDLCNGNKATELFSNALLTVVYEGDGEPKLKSIEKISSDKAERETSYHFGVAIKLPTDISTHFNEVGPSAGDVAAQKELASANGATSEFEVKKEYKEDGAHHVRGWLIHSKNTKKTGPINIVTESETRSDQFELNKDKHYMYTQHTTKAIQTVKAFDMLTAGVQAGKDAYLLTVVNVVVNNKGFAGEAEKALKQTAYETIKEMYKAANSVK